MISFAPTDEQRLIAETLDGFARTELRPAAKGLDKAGRLDDGLLDSLWRTGLLDLALGEDGEHARSRVSTCIALEKLGYADASVAVALAAPLAFVQSVMDHGSAAQRDAVRRDWSAGSYRAAAVAVQEPGFGFNPAVLRTAARADADGFVLSGEKAFVPLAHACTDFLVLATAEDRSEAFLVPADAPGVVVAKPAGSLGLKALGLADIRFDDVRLPRSARLGDGNGCDVGRIVDAARVGIAAILTGVCGAVLEHLVPYLQQRTAHGTALARKQSVAFRLADMAIDIPAMRWMCWRAADVMDKGRDASREARLAQVHAAEQAAWITDEGIQLMGGHGYMRDNPVERWYRDARMLAALEGVVGL